MDTPQFARTCRYAAPTLFLQWPYWLDAWTWPWSCTRDGRLHLMPIAAGCRQCPRWELREAGAEVPSFDTTQPVIKD